MTMNTHTSTCQGTVIGKSKALFAVMVAGQISHSQLAPTLARLIKNELDLPAIGDQVLLSTQSDGQYRIENILARRSLICRRAVTGKDTGQPSVQVIAANIDQLVAVMATSQPELKWAMLDRYTVMAEAQQIDVLICLTKSDLFEQLSCHEQAAFQHRCHLYRQLGYRLLFCSVQTLAGIAEVQHQLQGRTSLLLGKSGVGKTSLLNVLLPHPGRKVAAVNQVTGKGRHTTTALQWLTIDENSVVIDTPGTRELGLWEVTTDELDVCFPEMRPLLGQCKFRLGCHHIEEPGCAIRKAVVTGSIDPYRYQSYLKLMEEWR